jgi:hypothetical protein
VTKRQIQVTQRKISQGVEDMQVHGELLDGFSTTREFVNGLSKYMKISQICDNNNLRQCWTYDKVKVDDEGTEVEVSKQKDGAKAFHMAEGEWGETIGVTFGNGVQMLLAYKKNCAVEDDVRFDTDKDSGISGATKCLAGVWELNGAKGKNKYGDDVLPFNAGGFGGKACAAEIAGLCIITDVKLPTPMKTSEYCDNDNGTWKLNDTGKDLGIENCCTESNCITGSGDYWAGAVKQCKDSGGRLPTDQELTDLATFFYNKTVALDGTTNGTLDTSKVPTALSGIGSSWHDLWSNSEEDVSFAYYRSFALGNTSRNNASWYSYRRYNSIRAVCVID